MPQSRIATSQRLGRTAVTLDHAGAVVDGWMQRPQVRLRSLGANPFRQVMDLMAGAAGLGTLMWDAVIAVYGLEHRAVLFSSNADLARFVGLKRENPLPS